MNDLVSLIMPVINYEYVEESIISICKQTYKKWELLILVCDSHEIIEKVINKINEPRIQLIIFDPKFGLSNAFALGVNFAKGEYIIRHDPDDISLPKRIELQVKYLKNHNNEGMVSCCIKSFTNERIYKNECKNIDKVQNFYKAKECIDEAIIGGSIPIIFSTLMIRKSLLKNINFSNKKTDFIDEGELLLNLLKLSSVEKINKVLYRYRRHSKAYHIINRTECIKYTKTVLNDIDLKNFIRYREYHNEFINSEIEKIDANKLSCIRVLMLVDQLNIGGTETYVLNVAKNLMNMGVYVVVASLGGILEELFHSYGIKHIRISSNIQSKIPEDIKAVINDENINLLHCNLNRSMQIGKEVYKKYGIPYIITLHGMFYSKEILLSTCIEAKAVISVSNPVKGLFLENVKEKFKGISIVIANGVDTENFKPNRQHKCIRQKLEISKNDFVIIYCSRLSIGKGFIAENFISSIKKLSLKYNDIHGIIIGDGDKKCSIDKKAEEVNSILKRKAIHMVGARYDVLSYYLESDLVIGTGRVALEALSCGKSVIAAGSKGCIGIVGPKNKERLWNSYFGDHDGIVEDNDERLTKSIKYLIEYPEERLKLGEWSRRWCVERFEGKMTTKEIIKVYNSVLK